MGKYAVVIDRKALKFLEKLAKTHFETAAQFYAKFAQLSDAPYTGKPLKGSLLRFLQGSGMGL